MNDDTESKKSNGPPPQEVAITEAGVARVLTRGSPLFTPWLENGIPPYNHWLPVE
jgi:hypothetical protein